MPGAEAVHLRRDEERVDEIDLLARRCGGRVGIDGVLADLNRTAVRRPVPGRAVRAGYALDPADNLSWRWWPQGITTSADAFEDEAFAGRRLVVTSSYAKVVRGPGKGARITVLDVSNPRRAPYRHVLLVRASLRDGDLTLEPVTIHAGGIVWREGYLHVAATRRGLFTFRLEDIVAVGGHHAPDRIGRQHDGGLAAYGHRYVLPVRFHYQAWTADGEERLRYSFLSLARDGKAPQLLAGEYGRGQQTTRLIRYDLDPETGLVLADADGTSRPRAIDLAGIPRMQGATNVAGRLYVTQSRGRLRRGHLWSGPLGAPQPHRAALPPGPEDLCYWPSEDRLWSVSEHPLMRYVFSMDRGSFD